MKVPLDSLWTRFSSFHKCYRREPSSASQTPVAAATLPKIEPDRLGDGAHRMELCLTRYLKAQRPICVGWPWVVTTIVDQYQVIQRKTLLEGTKWDSRLLEGNPTFTAALPTDPSRSSLVRHSRCETECRWRPTYLRQFYDKDGAKLSTRTMHEIRSSSTV